MTSSSNHGLTLFNVGGTGANVGRQILQAARGMKDLPYGASLQPLDAFFIDTSTSNLRNTDIDPARIYVFEGMDGGAKRRGTNGPLIAKSVPKVLLNFKPSTFNLIVSSASGGSGAVIAHNLVKEIRQQGQHAIVLMVGSAGSKDEIDNSFKTLSSFDNLARDVLGSPVVMHLLENYGDLSRAQLDRHAVGAALMLLMLFSGQHAELDSEDLKRFLTHEALGREVVSLEIARNAEQYSSLKDVLAVATLAPTGADTQLTPIPAYQAVGLVDPHWSAKPYQLLGSEPVHFTLSSDLIVEASKKLTAKAKELEQQLKAHVKRDRLAPAADSSTDDGMVY